ncbi:MAG: sensor histidine kinase [Eubacterium sp.]|nr:sensor histidine kinase [Eubacterium sp.]
MFCVFTAIFAAVFFLYDIQGEAVLYAAVLCAAVAVVAVTIHFLRFRKKYLERKTLIGNIELLTEKLPDPCSPIEEQYTLMLEKLRAFSYDNQNKYYQERSDSIDYYTTWVHQIKTPISVMQMMLQSEDTEQNRALSAELFRIEQYVEMVLYRFRLDSEANDFVIESVSLDAVIRSAVRKYAPQFVQKKIGIIYSGTTQTVLSDEKWLLFIIEQLLSNAVKYTESGSVTISVTDGNILQVTDTGIGIAAEDLPRIFEKGYTGYNGRADKKSTGLGLYLCRRASEKLSHKIYAESEVGKGSTFYIDLSINKTEIE